jgi:hypothetical protein
VKRAQIRYNAKLIHPAVLDLGLGTQAIHGLSTKQGAASSHPESDPPSRDSGGLPAVVKGPPEPIAIITSRAYLLQGIPSPANSGGGSSVSLSALLRPSEDFYRTSIKDKHQIFGWNVISRRVSETPIQLMWLVLQDRVLVC